MIELNVIGADEAAQDSREAQPKERLWRSMGDLHGDPAQRKIAKNEFKTPLPTEAAAGKKTNSGKAKEPGGPSRRDFMKYMGASMALAGLTACRRPVEKILPYARKPEEVIPGVPLFYATAMPFRGALRGLLVESHEGRPTKVEGNPEHPASQGTTSVFEQAAVLNLYDPDRSRTVLRDGVASSWDDFLTFAQALRRQGGGQRVAVLIEETSSMTVQAQRERLQAQFPQLQWIPYNAAGDDAERLGMQQAFGRPLRPYYRFDQADVIVSLDADFLGATERDFIGNTRRFAESRRIRSVEDDMSRLYCVESGFSLTGGQADNRLKMRASMIPAFAAALGEALGVGTGMRGANFTAREQLFIDEIAQDLQQAGSRGLVLAGGTQPPEVHALCAALNGRLGSTGGAFTLLDTGEEARPPQSERLARLVRDMRAGNVGTLMMMGVNPVYDLPPAMGFLEAMRGVDETVHLGLHINETARASRWHLPRAHYLESWGDGRAYDGTVSIIQPLIEPLYPDAHSEIEVLAAVATGQDVVGYDLVREGWRARISGDFEKGWRRVLHEGFLPDTGYPTAGGASASAPNLQNRPLPDPDDLEVVFRLDPTLMAGEFSNNAWMQELPDPTTKLVWDNVAVMSRRTADARDLSVDYDTGQYYADVIEIATGEGATVELPVWIQPGYPDGTIGVNFGYGRAFATLREVDEPGFLSRLTNAYEGIYEDRDPIANGVGQNVALLRSPTLERVFVGAGVRKIGEGYKLVSTQEHGSMEGRPMVRRATLDTYRENPDFAEDAVHMLPGVPEEDWEEYPMLWQENHPSDQPAFVDSDYYENQWGMVIDLNTCTGCNACIVACQSENNIQVVGKEEVGLGREMHWLRLDRYYVSPTEQMAGYGEHAAGDGHAGDGAPGHDTQGDVDEEEGAYDEEAFDNPEMVVQPVLCMHCENAPCESVCPVYATVHSPDGTNQMVYNRCIGTRYCSNNCPYKVRRFNFFNWSKSIPTTVQMAQNPNVTVRFRGVMEKCSFCVQRIREAQGRANIEDRGLEDGEVITACQGVCPADAITFGDLNNPNSRVSRLKESTRRYELLAELNTKPRLSYLGRVTNPNPRLKEGQPA